MYLSGGIYGVETMSRKMFRKPASQLTLGEAALIAGIIRAPASYSPWTHLDAARRRSFVVLQRMREEKKITAAQEQAARAERIQIQPLSSVSGARHGYAKEFLRQQFRDVYGGDNPPDWKVHTTFVPEIQDAAEIAVRDGLRRIGVRDLQAALVAIDPQIGEPAGDRRRLGLRDDALQSRRAQQASAGLGVQAVRLCGGARERPVTGLDDHRPASGRRAGARRRLDSARRARDGAGLDDAA